MKREIHFGAANLRYGMEHILLTNTIFSTRYCDLLRNVLIFAYRYNIFKAENIKHSYKYMKKQAYEESNDCSSHAVDGNSMFSTSP